MPTYNIRYTIFEITKSDDNLNVDNKPDGLDRVKEGKNIWKLIVVIP